MMRWAEESPAFVSLSSLLQVTSNQSHHSPLTTQVDQSLTKSGHGRGSKHGSHAAMDPTRGKTLMSDEDPFMTKSDPASRKAPCGIVSGKAPPAEHPTKLPKLPTSKGPKPTAASFCFSAIGRTAGCLSHESPIVGSPAE